MGKYYDDDITPEQYIKLRNECWANILQEYYEGILWGPEAACEKALERKRKNHSGSNKETA